MKTRVHFKKKRKKIIKKRVRGNHKKTKSERNRAKVQKGILNGKSLILLEKDTDVGVIIANNFAT